ncbi:MAG: hypothetical protein ACI4UF_05015, partial [Thermoguttaceae bacterium]
SDEPKYLNLIRLIRLHPPDPRGLLRPSAHSEGLSVAETGFRSFYLLRQKIKVRPIFSLEEFGVLFFVGGAGIFSRLR